MSALGQGPIIGGSAALAHAGWTTQFQQMPDMLFRDSAPDRLPGARAHAREAARFDILLRWLAPAPSADWGVPVLDPVMAIADAWLDPLRRTHIYDPDDLDPDEVGEAGLSGLEEALGDLGADPNEIRKCLDHYRLLGGYARTGQGINPAP